LPHSSASPYSLFLHPTEEGGIHSGKGEAVLVSLGMADSVLQLKCFEFGFEESGFGRSSGEAAGFLEMVGGFCGTAGLEMKFAKGGRVERIFL
jgi:hypothetical protein